MFGNGSMIGMVLIVASHKQIHRVLLQALTVSVGVVAGAMVPLACGFLLGLALAQVIAAVVWASALLAVQISFVQAGK